MPHLLLKHLYLHQLLHQLLKHLLLLLLQLLKHRLLHRLLKPSLLNPRKSNTRVLLNKKADASRLFCCSLK